MLPEFVRIRTPELIFRATDQGYNIRNFYNACEEYADSYYFLIVFIRTTEGGILGCLIDEVPEPTSKSVFQGSLDSFVFCLYPDVKHFKFTGANEMQMLADINYLAIGMGGEGPALRLDEKLQYGKSYRSLTYENEILTCKAEDDFKKNEFEV